MKAIKKSKREIIEEKIKLIKKDMEGYITENINNNHSLDSRAELIEEFKVHCSDQTDRITRIEKAIWAIEKEISDK